VQHTQTAKPTDSPSTQCMYSDGIHPVESILIDPQYTLSRISTAVDILDNIRGVSGRKVSVFGDYCFGHCEKKVHMNMCLASEWLPRCSRLNIHTQMRCEWNYVLLTYFIFIFK
jgi:hypothetical protein